MITPLPPPKKKNKNKNKNAKLTKVSSLKMCFSPINQAVSFKRLKQIFDSVEEILIICILLPRSLYT